MKTTQSVHVRVAVAIDRGQKRISCNTWDYDEASRYGIRDPKDNKRFIAAFHHFDDVKTGFFAYFNEAFIAAAKKAWHMDKPKEASK